MTNTWTDFRKTLNLTPEEEEMINLEKALINAIIDAREENGLIQKQLSEICGINPQINSIISILQPLGYTLAVVKQDAINL